MEKFPEDQTIQINTIGPDGFKGKIIVDGVEYAPVIRARWIPANGLYTNMAAYKICSACHVTLPEIPELRALNYCPKCGARMDQEASDV